MFKSSSLPTVFIFLTVFRLPGVVSGFCFQDYPSCSQNVLYETAPPGCDFGCTDNDLSAQTNHCLCDDSSYMKTLAQQLYTSCGCSELLDSTQVWFANCNATGTPSLMSESSMIAAGEGNNQQCTRVTNPSPAGTTNNDSSSTKAKVVLAVGLLIGGAFLSFILAVAWDVYKIKREEKKKKNPSRPTSQLIEESVRNRTGRMKTTTQSIAKRIQTINCCSINWGIRYDHFDTNANGSHNSYLGTHDETDDEQQLYDHPRYPPRVRRTNTTWGH